MGLRWLWYDRFGRTTIILQAGATLISQALIMTFLAASRTGGFPSIVVGVVLAGSGLGGLMGSAATRLLVGVTHSWLRIQMSCWVMVFVILVLSGGKSPLCVLGAMVVLGFTGAMGNVEVSAYLIQAVPANMFARVMSIGRMMSFGASTTGPLLGAFLYQLYGIKDAIFLLLAMTTTLAVSSILSPSMRPLRVPSLEVSMEAAIGMRSRSHGASHGFQRR